MTSCATTDFETRSVVSLRKSGVWRYSLDPSTEILCLAYRLPSWPTGRTALWHPAFPHLGILASNEPELPELLQWILDGGLVEAHNAFFERCIWRHILEPRYGFPPIPAAQWRDSAVKAAAHALPRALEDVTNALRLVTKKDMVGSKLMQKLAKPRKIRKAELEAWKAQHGRKKPPILYYESKEWFERLWAYCRQDVLAEAAVSECLPDSNAFETELYTFDQIINDRGFTLDRQAILAALQLLERESTRLNAELMTLTDGVVERATQRARLLVWLEAQGLKLYDTQKTTLEEVLESNGESAFSDLTPAARQAVEILRTLGRSSTAKYQAMQNWIAPDNRVHGGLLFHGASTGRWTGMGVQPHNFPKGTLKDFDPDFAWEALKICTPEEICAEWGSVTEPLSCALRGVITASPGRQLFVADYASIEARVLLWLAKDEESLGIFRRHEDPYCVMASDIYDRVITKADKNERQLGKAAVLGCFTTDTEVLTDRGWVSISTVQLSDRVWDGVEWVQHEGVRYQGRQTILRLRGIGVTPDHRILTPDGWRESADVLASSRCQQSANALALSQLPNIFSVHAEASPESFVSVTAVPNLLSTSVISDAGQPDDVMSVRSERLVTLEKNSAVTPLFALLMIIGVACWIASPRYTSVAIILSALLSKITEVVESEWSGPTLEQVDKHSSHIWFRFLGGRIQHWKSIVSTMTGTMHRGIYVSQPEVNKFETNVATFDVVNTGPRHRFFVRSLTNPSFVLCVHNCGYQMGASRFVETAAMYGVTIDEDFAKIVVDAYRERFWRVKAMWAEQEAAAIKAVQRPKTRVKAGRVIWVVEGRFLYCELPSGRRLAYCDPKIQDVQTSWGQTRSALIYMGVNSYNHKWTRQSTYGGMLVENITQAVARDIMAEAMWRCEQTRKYHVVLTVHDEIVAEAHPALGTVPEFVQLLTTIPDWAKGCPIDAEGWTGTRYAKS